MQLEKKNNRETDVSSQTYSPNTRCSKNSRERLGQFKVSGLQFKALNCDQNRVGERVTKG